MGAKNIDDFRMNLREGVESIATFSPKELAASNVNSSALENPSFVPAGRTINIELRRSVSGFSPRAAESFDTRQCIFSRLHGTLSGMLATILKTHPGTMLTPQEVNPCCSRPCSFTLA